MNSTEDMVKAIRENLNREPFRAFELVMSSGDRFTIKDPQLIAFAGLHMSYYFPKSDGHVDMNVAHIAYLQVGEKSCL